MKGNALKIQRTGVNHMTKRKRRENLATCNEFKGIASMHTKEQVV